MDLKSEVQKIEEVYRQRSKRSLKENHYFNFYLKAERELIYTNIINSLGYSDIGDCRIMEIGAGGGDNLLFFHRLGINWKNLYANELMEDRVTVLQQRLLSDKIFAGNALDLTFKKYFDIVFQSTVFSSILDDDFKRLLALKMMEIAKVNGIILWYDFKFNNPRNKNVKGIKKKEIRRLFREAKSITFYNVTLAPPIGRIVGKWYQLINFLFPFFRTHLISIIKL